MRRLSHDLISVGPGSWMALFGSQPTDRRVGLRALARVPPSGPSPWLAFRGSPRLVCGVCCGSTGPSPWLAFRGLPRVVCGVCCGSTGPSPWLAFRGSPRLVCGVLWEHGSVAVARVRDREKIRTREATENRPKSRSRKLTVGSVAEARVRRVGGTQLSGLRGYAAVWVERIRSCLG